MPPTPLTESHWPADLTGPPLLDRTVADLLAGAARDAPDATALVEGVADAAARRRWSFAELLADAERSALVLAERFGPGERLAVWAPNRPEWVIVQLAAALAGLTLVTVNPAFRAREAAYVLGQSRSSGVVVEPEFRGNPMLETVERLRGDLPDLREVITFGELGEATASAPSHPPVRRLGEARPGDPAQIQYTSGTTGFPKGAQLHHRGITNNARLTMAALGLDAGAYLDPMPLFHTAGSVIGVLGCLATRSTHVLVGEFDAALCLDLVEQERPDVMLAVPTMLIALLEQPDLERRDLSSLRRVVSGGALVAAELVRRIEERLGVDFTILYGQTESSPMSTATLATDSLADKTGTVGRPMPHTEVKVVDPATGRTVPTGTVGELCCRGYLVMDGYFDMPEQTAQAIDGGGWLHTGDLGTMDERGYCTVVGRLKDMVIRGGENIYPREIEDLLFEHPAVAEVAVVGVPDERWGEQVAAFVRPADERPAVAELRHHCRTHLAPHKTPAVWVFVDEFPLTTSGKVQKFVLRDRYLAGEVRAEPTG